MIYISYINKFNMRFWHKYVSFYKNMRDIIYRFNLFVTINVSSSIWDNKALQIKNNKIVTLKTGKYVCLTKMASVFILAQIGY